MSEKFKITTRVPVCHLKDTIGNVREYLLQNIKDLEAVDYIYVVSKNEQLKGVISIHSLFKCNAKLLVKDCVVTDLVKVYKHTDKEEIAYLAVRNNIKSVPIVDEVNKFQGIVDSDEILHILNDELNEDMMYFSGIIPKNKVGSEEISVFRNFLTRIPWLLIGLLGGIMAAKLIGIFVTVLEKEILLASFIPLVAYIANAVGTQTQMLYIRDYALKHNISMLKYTIKQLLVSFLIGVVCWGMIGIISLIFWQSQTIGLVVGFAVFSSIMVAPLFALLIPFILIKLNKDPAMGSGPFTNIIQDILSVLIFFLIASFFLL